MKKVIYSTTPVDASLKKNIEKASSVVKKLFKKLGKFLEDVDKWTSGDHDVFEIRTEIPTDGETPTYFRMLLKCVGTGDGYIVVDAYLKRRGEDDSNKIAATGIKFDTRDEGQSQDDYLQQFDSEFKDLVSDLLRKYTSKYLPRDNEFHGWDSFDDIKLVNE